MENTGSVVGRNMFCCIVVALSGPLDPHIGNGKIEGTVGERQDDSASLGCVLSTQTLYSALDI